MKKRRFLFAVTASLIVALVAGGCQKDSGDEARRLTKVENSVGEIPDLTKKLETLQTSDEGTAAQTAALQASIDELKTTIDDLEKDVTLARSADTDLKKRLDDLSAKVNPLSAKIDSLSAKVGAAEQKTALLETRYNDHLRKYHNGG